MNNKILFVVLFVLFAFFPKHANAAPNTDFSACVNPQGSLIADYANGTHGIVNNTGLYTGSDKVYILSDGNAMQCFCGSNNEGIQTNWLKNTGFTDSEIAVLKNQGWTSIPDGSVWGLDPVQYFAMNSSYACAGASSQPTSQSSPNNSSSNPSQSVLGASTTVLTSLANTGNSLLFYSTLILGIGFIIAGLFLPGNKKSSR